MKRKSASPNDNLPETFDPTTPEPPFRDWIKKLQHHIKVSEGGRKTNVKKLIAMSPASDPYYIGGSQEKAAAWFAELYRRLNLGRGAYLRRIHYRALDLKDFKKPNGTPYLNTIKDWALLGKASKWARILGLMPAHDLEDRRNPDAVEATWMKVPRFDPSPYISPAEIGTLSLPDIWLGGFSLPAVGEEPTARGYGANDYADRPIYCELWIEKTSMDDILKPLCENLGVTFVPAAGNQSITASINMLQRVQRLKKPGRVFYISDYDPAGKNMPLAVSRQLEFWRRVYAPDCDVKLSPLALGREQVREYRLPKNVIEWNKKWKETEGEFGVELDALEGKVPGELERIVRGALRPYLDGTLPKRLREAEEEADEAVEEEWSAKTSDIEDELSRVRAKVQEIIQKKYQPRVDALNAKLEEELRPHKKQLETLRAAFVEAANNFDVELPERPAPKKPNEKGRFWLFDSSRTYLEQLKFYRERKDGVAHSNEGEANKKKR
jgi:hypothetical protein